MRLNPSLVLAASVLIGASRAEQIAENVKALEHTEFSEDERGRIDALLQANRA